MPQSYYHTTILYHYDTIPVQDMIVTAAASLPYRYRSHSRIELHLLSWYPYEFVLSFPGFVRSFYVQAPLCVYFQRDSLALYGHDSSAER
jgi:hypothetical protein